ncbi:MAG: hypothetical protein M3040_00485 [Bacteroidota bacterium]|nr:hypothetical protein [Bacteroidota bacterium]
MPKGLVILHKVLVNYFYRVNSGLFVVAFFVLFGTPYSPLTFHYSLITGIIQSQLFLGLVMLGWLLYNAKCVDYVLKQLQHSQQTFLFSLNALPIKKVYFYHVYVQVLVYLPVLLYSAAVVVIAFKKHAYIPGIEIMLFNLAIIFITPLLYVFALQQNRRTLSPFLFPSVHVKMRRYYFFFPIYFVFTDRKQMLLVTKISSLIVLYGFIMLYEPERYDIRPIQLCLLLVAAAHCAVVFEIRQFENDYLEFVKNLPITLTGRFLRMVAMFAVLLLPEMILLLKGLHSQFLVNDYPFLLLMLIALLCLFHVVLMLENVTMEQMIRTVFAILAACFFIILYNAGTMLIVTVLVLAFVLYQAYYYHYEKKYD